MAIPLDYLVIGHVTRDLDGSTHTVGGTAAYAALTARALGCRVGVVTSAGAELNLNEALSGLLITQLPARSSTTFENVYTTEGRQQVLHGVARPLGPEAVPDGWQPQVVHIGPVARECDPALLDSFGNAFVGVTPQGWMREWGDDGLVRRRRWHEADRVLRRADAVVLSEEDVGSDRSIIADYARQTRRLVLTQGAAGCTVYAHGDVRQLPAPEADEVDPTGAGDVFAAALFHALQRHHDVWSAASFANCLASRSVTRSALLGAPLAREVAHCKQSALGSEKDDAHHLRAR